jgi:hypothetical protein
LKREEADDGWFWFCYGPWLRNLTEIERRDERTFTPNLDIQGSKSNGTAREVLSIQRFIADCRSKDQPTLAIIERGTRKRGNAWISDRFGGDMRQG